MAALAACGPGVPVASPSGEAGLAASGVRASSAPAQNGTSRTLQEYGVLVDLASDPKTYTIYVVSAKGQVAATVKANRRSLPPGALELPYVSTTTTALYYLDNGYQVRKMDLNGLTVEANPVAQLDVPDSAEVVVSISPDDRTMAWSLLRFSTTSAHDYLYVDPVGGVLEHMVYDSASNYVWPVAWHGGLLVLAHAYSPFLEGALKAAPGQDNPYWAISYHVVDPATANRKVLMGSCTVSGPLSPAGSACIQGGTIDWAGSTTPWSTNDWGSISSAASLSPDGSLVAAAKPDNDRQLAFWRRGGDIATWVDGPGSRDWAGWLDDTHVLVTSASADFQPRVVFLGAGASPATPVDARGFYAARLPTDVT